jgi:hypothetical protein
VIVLSGVDEASTLQFLAPYTGAKSSCSGPQIVWFAEAHNGESLECTCPYRRPSPGLRLRIGRLSAFRSLRPSRYPGSGQVAVTIQLRPTIVFLDLSTNHLNPSAYLALQVQPLSSPGQVYLEHRPFTSSFYIFHASPAWVTTSSRSPLSQTPLK